MKYLEIAKIAKDNGWKFIRIASTTRHYLWGKNGKTISIPYHRGKDVNRGLEKKILIKIKG